MKFCSGMAYRSGHVTLLQYTLLQYGFIPVERTTHSRRLHADNSIRARDGGHNMDLPSPVEAVHRRGAETRVAMYVTGLTSARNCSAVQ